MPQYGFVIDQRRCIGCHACTVACKTENGVPTGIFRTWVKYTEQGRFPRVRRHFTVLRCNHCDAAPCVEICPTMALYKRPDAIVDLDREQCIGCRACMQACPYDALAVHPEEGTVEKCHYCAHRVESGLAPACVTVCPEEAILAGDLEDTATPVATLAREEGARQRKPGKGTRPRLWYVGALPEALTPGAAAEPAAWLWAERPLPPPETPGFAPRPDLVDVFDVDHPPPWGWHVWAYLLTKNLAAGSMLLAPLAAALGLRAGVVPEFLALLFLTVTGALLVHDLGRPERALKLLTRGNPRSWLVRGTWALLAFGTVTSLTLLLRLAGATGAADTLRWLNIPLALLASGYTAFLLAQCQGRDLWLEPGVLGHLLLQALLFALTLGLLLPGSGAALFPNATLLFGLLALASAGWLLGEIRDEGGSPDARRARALLRARPDSRRAVGSLFLAGLAGAYLSLMHARDPGSLVLLVLLKVALAGAVLLASTWHERAWIRAGQEVPLS